MTTTTEPTRSQIIDWLESDEGRRWFKSDYCEDVPVGCGHSLIEDYDLIGETCGRNDTHVACWDTPMFYRAKVHHVSAYSWGSFWTIPPDEGCPLYSEEYHSERNRRVAGE